MRATGGMLCMKLVRSVANLLRLSSTKDAPNVDAVGHAKWITAATTSEHL